MIISSISERNNGERKRWLFKMADENNISESYKWKNEMRKVIKQAVIFAGGYGKRLAPFTDTNPKPMYPICGKPFIEYLIIQIKSYGITNIVILLGYLPDKVIDYLGDGSKYGVNIQYFVTDVECETEKRLKAAYEVLDNCFLMMYCDNYCPVDYEKLVDDYFRNNALIQITAYNNKDGYTKNNLKIDDAGKVIVYDKKRVTEGLQGVDIGYAIINKKVLELMDDENNNFEAVVYPKVVEKGKMFSTSTEHRYYSIGSFERIELTKEFFGKKKYVFLDRDGTLNVRPPKACYIEKADDFVWLDGAKDAVKRLNDAGFVTVLVSNQPGIARGRLTEETLHEIHQKMQADLAKIDAHIDYIYYCPHNWNEGCECRKPKPGMLYMAQKDLSINLRLAYLIGDDDRDIEAGEAVGCKCYRVDDQYTLLDAVKDILTNSIE